jgi:hypothetical protein
VKITKKHCEGKGTQTAVCFINLQSVTALRYSPWSNNHWKRAGCYFVKLFRTCFPTQKKGIEYSQGWIGAVVLVEVSQERQAECNEDQLSPKAAREDWCAGAERESVVIKTGKEGCERGSTY